MTVAPDEEVAAVLMFDGTPLNAGGVVSTTVTVNEPVGLGGIAPSSQFTVVGPNGNGDPDAGTQLKPALSYVTVAPPGPVASTLKLPGRASARADASGVPHSTTSAQTAMSPRTLIL